MNNQNNEPSSFKAKFIVIGIIALTVLVAGYYFNFPSLLQQALNWIQGVGIFGYVVFIILYILSCIFFIPGTVLTLGAGAIYGVVLGSAIVSIASTLGAAAAFLVGRYAARDFVERKIEGNQTFKSIDEAVAREGGRIVFLTRLSPLFPFSLLNYAYGLTKVKFFSYFIASWIGMMPGTVMYVYIGSLGSDLATVSAGEQSYLKWILNAVGFIATVVVSVYVGKIAKKALEAKVDTPLEVNPESSEISSFESNP